MERARISARRVALLPAIALAVTASTCAIAVGARANATAEHRSHRAEVEVFADLRRLVQADLAVQLTLVALWNTEMGHRVDLAEPLDRARSAVEEARRSDPLTEGLQVTADKIAAVSGTDDGRTRIAAMREAHNALLKLLVETEQRGGARTGTFHDGFGRLLATDDRYTFVTARRSLAGVDPPPTEPDMRFYVAGLVAGASTTAAIPTMTELLTANVTAPALRGSLTDLAQSDAVAPFAADFAWASTDDAPPTTPSPASAHPTFEALDSSRKAAVFGITQLLVDEIDAQSDAIDAEARAATRRGEQWGLRALAALAAGALALAWLLARLRRSMATLHRAAETDPLTGALNRLGLRHAAAPWFADRGDGPVALAVVDLDHFKAVNDTHGHEAGDEVLRSVASRLTTATVADHTAVSRWGGDEFVVAFRFPDGLPDGAVDRISARLIARLAEPIELADTVVGATVTIGIATCRCGGCDLDDLFRAADHALYAGKFEGRNRATDVACGFDLQEHLQAAIERADVTEPGPERSTAG